MIVEKLDEMYRTIIHTPTHDDLDSFLELLVELCKEKIQHGANYRAKKKLYDRAIRKRTQELLQGGEKYKNRSTEIAEEENEEMFEEVSEMKNNEENAKDLLDIYRDVYRHGRNKLYSTNQDALAS